MYKRDCSTQYGLPDFECLSVVGWTITIICTYTGYICLIVGMLWAVDIKQKIVRAYRSIREAQRRAKERKQASNEETENQSLLSEISVSDDVS